MTPAGVFTYDSGANRFYATEFWKLAEIVSESERNGVYFHS